MQTNEKARAVTAAVRGNSVLVYAAGNVEELLKADHAYKILNKKEFSSFKCQDCGTHMHAVASVNPEPFCVTCGSEKVEHVTNKKLPATAALVSDKEIASVVCPSCNLHNVVQSNVLKASAGDLHCCGCGSHLTVAGYEELPEAEMSKDACKSADDVDTLNEEDATMTQEDNFPVVDEELTQDIENLTEDMTVSEEGFDDQDMLALSSEEETMEMDTDLEDFDEMADEDNADEVAESFSEGESFMDMTAGDEEEELGNELIEPLAEGEPLMEAIDMDNTIESLSFVVKSNRLVAMKGFYAIATASQQSAGRNADMLGTPEFEQALRIQASKVGLRKALAQFGFQPLKAKAVDTAVIARKTVEATVKAQNEMEAQRRVFSDCLALAAVGMSRNVWKAQKNELKASVEAALQQFGVRNPKRITANLFAEKGLEYTKSLVEVATKLSKMSSQARKEYADMLDLVDEEDQVDLLEEQVEVNAENNDDMPMNDYSFESAEDMADDELMDLAEEVESVTSRFVTTAHPVQAKKQNSTAVTANAILAGTAPLRFNV